MTGLLISQRLPHPHDFSRILATSCLKIFSPLLPRIINSEGQSKTRKGWSETANSQHSRTTVPQRESRRNDRLQTQRPCRKHRGTKQTQQGWGCSLSNTCNFSGDCKPQSPEFLGKKRRKSTQVVMGPTTLSSSGEAPKWDHIQKFKVR